MPKKPKPTKEQRRQIRLQKGKQWLLTYNGSPKHMNKHYREKFHVDAMTAAKDLQALGINYTQEQLDQIKRSEEQRLEQHMVFNGKMLELPRNYRLKRKYAFIPAENMR